MVPLLPQLTRWNPSNQQAERVSVSRVLYTGAPGVVEKMLEDEELNQFCALEASPATSSQRTFDAVLLNYIAVYNFTYMMDILHNSAIFLQVFVASKIQGV